MGTKTQKLSNVIDQIVEWQSVFTGDGSTGLTAVAGRGYFIDTTSGTVTVTLPASPKIGDIVQLKDYARTWETNNVTLASTLLDGATDIEVFKTNGKTVTLVYMDGTKGWSLINEDTTSKLENVPTFIAATGGTITTSSDYKIHTFTGDGCFTVSSVGNLSDNPLGGPNAVDYLVIAGGGGGGADLGAGGGAGGLRVSSGTASGCWTSSPLGACVSALPVSVTTYPVTVGAGGAPQSSPNPTGGARGGSGSNSIFSTITSAGGGGGGGAPEPHGEGAGANGGSGGGGSGYWPAPLGTGGSGNTPPVSPPQGNNGGNGGGGGPGYPGAGGGGAGAVGTTPPNSTSVGGAGGAGIQINIDGNNYYWAGGGGGGSYNPAPASGNGGIGGGGGGGRDAPGTAEVVEDVL